MARSALNLSDAEVDTLRARSLLFRLSPHALSFDDFERFVFNVRRLIGDVSYAVARNYGGWVLTGLQYGSAGVATAPRSLGENDVRVERVILDGLRDLQRGTDVPEYFSERALRCARLIVLLARDEAVEVRGPDVEPIVLRAEVSDHITTLLTARRRYFGSVVGDLDAVSVHRGTRATIYGDEGRVVSCRLPSSLLSDVKDLLGARVVAVGEISANRLGSVISVRAEQLYAAPRPAHLPTISALYGALPDLTGGMPSSQYVKRLWGAD